MKGTYDKKWQNTSRWHLCTDNNIVRITGIIFILWHCHDIRVSVGRFNNCRSKIKLQYYLTGQDMNCLSTIRNFHMPQGITDVMIEEVSAIRWVSS